MQAYNPAAATEPEMRLLLAALVLLLRPRLVVETGCYFGEASLAIGFALAENEVGCLVTCDTDAELVLKLREESHRAGLPLVAKHCRGEELPELPAADLVFIDSDYQDRPREIGLCKPGAIVVVHDTRVSHADRVPPLAGLVRALGGIAFPSARGFGILVKR